MPRYKRQLTFTLILLILWAVSLIAVFSHYTPEVANSEIEMLRAQTVALKALVKLSETPTTIIVTEPQNDTGWKIIKLTNDYEDLCKMVEAEATSEGYEGKLAVAEVVLNRIKDGRFEKTISKVIFEPGQFDSVDDGRMKAAIVTNETRMAVDEALRGQKYDAIFFLNPDDSGPVSKEWVRRLEFVATIGKHDFYK